MEKKATYNLRLNRVNDEYIPVFEGEQISIDGIDADYDSVCRPCYKKLRRQYGKKKGRKVKKENTNNIFNYYFCSLITSTSIFLNI